MAMITIIVMIVVMIIIVIVVIMFVIPVSYLILTELNSIHGTMSE